MKEICPKIDCTGCGLCAGVCPYDCIEIKGDEYGYLYPKIDPTRCVNCKLCQKTCPNNRHIEFRKPQNVYAAWTLNEEERRTSISGGIAAELSRYIVSIGGVVYGAVGSVAGYVSHQRATEFGELDKFKRSKYVQSTITREIFIQLKNDVIKDRLVLFIGTPCQTAAVRAILPHKANLLCVEIICHGVPSQQILQDHMDMVTGKSHNLISEFTTRDNEGNIQLKVGEKIVYRKSGTEDSFMNGFQQGLFFRPSCYQCHYARPERQSDLTIGDFWGLDNTSYSHHKVSLILENTLAGTSLIKALTDKLFLEKRSFDEASRANAQLIHPSHKHPKYHIFQQLYLEKGYPTAIKSSLKGYYRKLFFSRLLSKVPGFYRLGLYKLFKL